MATEMARPRTIDKTGKQPASKQVALRLTEAQYTRLRKRAQTRGVSVAQLLREMARVA
jgi:predicted DNA-binding ribbon-helix-helix protein